MSPVRIVCVCPPEGDRDPSCPECGELDSTEITAGHAAVSRMLSDLLWSEIVPLYAAQ